ncbi:hypothetical protein WA026_003395 [Henosepilachna vigintioctopunctata]|uniref:C-type lectin domain-containing protein n=1 Tax=Henosepilachna vigintioctopunctata TaxID=420089 RepID=A0AAW1TJF4_9CUCU
MSSSEKRRCSSKRNPACSLEFSLIGTKCYHFSNEATNWDEAYYDCLGKNSSLAILSNAKEEKYLRNFLKRHYRAFGEKNRWIGGKFDWKNDQWVWAETGEKLSYRAFAKSPPKDKRLLQWTCIVMDSSRKNKWTFKSCMQRNNYICQKQPRHSIRIRKKFNIRICKRSASQLNENQKKKCLKLVGGYGGKNFQIFQHRSYKHQNQLRII